ncbi:MAG: AAA family ATPase [bacterium]|nr:AAA family ATPase [bacterium]
MIYLSQFTFPDVEEEYDFLMGIRRTCYDTFYPFQVLSRHRLRQLDFETVTILYGGNGSGKSTALNVMAEKLALSRDTLYNRSNFFEDYTKRCTYRLESGKRVKKGRIITSDDVFDFMLDLRTINEGVDSRREEMFDEYMELKYSHFRMRSLEDYEQLKKVNNARSRTQSKYIRENHMDNVREHSNGESAFAYFTEKITENGLFLLDEPENSLSPGRQRELVQFVEDAARFYGCQFVIATHSPFVLSMRGAKIYDLDEEPVDVKRWTELKNVRAYYDFFKEHEREFG